MRRSGAARARCIGAGHTGPSRVGRDPAAGRRDISQIGPGRWQGGAVAGRLA
jgi:hypothetical protein